MRTRILNVAVDTLKVNSKFVGKGSKPFQDFLYWIYLSNGTMYTNPALTQARGGFIAFLREPINSIFAGLLFVTEIDQVGLLDNIS